MSEDEKTTDWKESLPEDLRNASEIQTFTSPEALAKSYVENSKMLSQRHPGVSKDDDFDGFSSKAQKFLKIPEKVEEYEASDDSTYNALSHKYKLHPEFQAKPFLKEFQELQEKNSKARVSGNIQKWEQETQELFKDVENKDEIIGKAFAKMKTTREEFEGSLKEFSKHPQINKLLLTLGAEKSSDSSKTPKLTGEGGEGGALSIQEKKDFVEKHIQNPTSPYFDIKSPNHTEIRMKVDQFTQQLSSHEAKTGIGLFKGQYSKN